MQQVVLIARWEGVILLGAYLGVIVWKLLAGELPMAGLLDGDVREMTKPSSFSCQPSMGRAQSLTVALFVALWYLLQVIQNPSQFPDLPAVLLGAFGGSQTLYLGAKARAMFIGRLRNLFK